MDRPSPASDIARRLGDKAEAVCRRYLSNGRREGQYWLVGDVRNAPGRSLYVRLVHGDGRAPGKWTDAANGEHGDLLDVIAAVCGHYRLRDTLDEARHFLSLPPAHPSGSSPRGPAKPRRRAVGAAQGLWDASGPVDGTRVSDYLAARHIHLRCDLGAIRFHPRCFYRPSEDDGPDCRKSWPAMVAAVTDDAGTVMGVHRTWLAIEGQGKAPIACPRRAMGHLLGHGVRFGAAAPVMAAGEGIETLLSLREVMPSLPLVAGLSGAHLAAIAFPPILSRLYVAVDRDAAGAAAFERLAARALSAGIEIRPLEPRCGDFNDDLGALGRDKLAAALRVQLAPDDRALLQG